MMLTAIRKPLFLYVPFSEKILLVKHLSIMVKSGMTLVDALGLLKKQARSSSLKYILEDVTQNVQNGQFLYASLKKYWRQFDDLFVNVVRIGEETGNLADNLSYLATELKKKQLLRQKVQAALIYPVVILVATLSVTAILVFMVLPRLLPIFQSLGVKLPWSTRALIAISDFLFRYGAALFLAILSLGIIWYFLVKRVRVIKFFAHRAILSLPFLGALSVMSNVADFTRTLGLLLKSGTKIVEAVLIAADSARNEVYAQALKEAADILRKGKPLNVYLEKRESMFPPTATRMIEVGSLTGMLEANLFYLADFYETEIDETTKRLTSILEPLLLLVMGAIVGFVAISIITPIYEITQTFRR